MSMSKDALEGMATILRENGYKVALKDSETKESDTKMPYNSNRFNKIRDLDLKSLSYDTCLFLSETVIEDFKLHDYGVASQDVTIGYIDNDKNSDDIEDIIICTNRIGANDRGIKEMLSDYDYVIKLADVFKLMASNEEFND